MASRSGPDRGYWPYPRGAPGGHRGRQQNRGERAADDQRRPARGHGDRCRTPAGHGAEQQRHEQARPDQAHSNSGNGQQPVLGREHERELDGSKSERLQHAELAVLDQHSPAGDVDNGQHRRAQSDQPEQGQDEAEQRIAPGHRLLDLLPGGHRADRTAADLCHHLLHDEAGAGRVGDLQPDDLLGAARIRLDPLQQRGQHPDQARGLIRVKPLIRGLGQARHPNPGSDRSVNVVQRQLVANRCVDGLGKGDFQHHSAGSCRAQPVTGRHEGPTDGWQHRAHSPQFDSAPLPRQ